MVVACLGGLAFGLLGGFLKIVIPLLFLLCGIALAGGVSAGVGAALPDLLGGERSQIAIVFLLALAGLLVVGMAVAGLVSLGVTAASAAVSATPMGAMLNRAGGAVAGLVYGCVLLSVFLIALQQVPVASVSDAIGESSLAHGPIGWVDKYTPAIEISPDWSDPAD